MQHCTIRPAPRNYACLRLLGLLVLALTLAACGSGNGSGRAANAPPAAAATPQPAGSLPYVDLAPPAFKDLIQDRTVVLVNVHIPYEGQIPGTRLQVAYDQVAEEIGKFPADRAVKLAVYCLSGRMSDIAGRQLAQLGYRNVYNLRGGMLAWAEAGLALTDWRR